MRNYRGEAAIFYPRPTDWSGNWNWRAIAMVVGQLSMSNLPDEYVDYLIDEHGGD